jgi:hypothetical protein
MMINDGQRKKAGRERSKGTSREMEFLRCRPERATS